MNTPSKRCRLSRPHLAVPTTASATSSPVLAPASDQLAIGPEDAPAAPAARVASRPRTADKQPPTRRQSWGSYALIALVTLCLWTPLALADGIAELKDYLSGLNSLSADFRQITLSNDGSQMLESTGTFYLLRPDRFRWDYDSPTEQEIVADGQRIYVHDKELEQVTHSSQKKILDGTPAQLLASEQPVEDYFELRNLDEGDDRTWVELIPKTEDTEVAKLRIAFIDDQLDTLLMEDRFGQLTRFIFTNLERNPQLDYAMFRFEQPAGSDFLQVD
ncbi:outer membrane lipoprotein chaperone LolA [Halochromatium glycolicum]|uniref:Outer-membrane lipoprotein carrier protein n=1 Tax=Halochromatium glycolicum TaxID=85075 RepID=A0AAJ0XAB1_9GAMM|nr:outer membrane lipoprotein chaperone LolA [Halochromatium glycolicum]MBK1705138.1 outer membrane lipoprotein carrier protein LolA [Halochromatium glycolicum]